MPRSTLLAPTTSDPSAAPTLRWGILGPGGIARSFAEALQARTRQEVSAVGSRDLDRARAFADEHGGTAYGSYEDLVADPSVDIVYVASPHSEHREHALLAIGAGKHVLVEKAFTRNAAEAREVLEAARAAGVYCAEAMWSRYLPHYDVIRRAVADHVIGELRWVAADHGQALHPGGPQRLWDPELAGGALLDLGVYPVSLAAMLMPDIAAVSAVGTLTAGGVDAQEVVTLTGPGTEDAVVAVCTATMLAQTPCSAVVAGTAGRLEIDGWFYQPTTVGLVTPEDGETDVYSASADGDTGLAYEAAEAARCIAAGRTETELMPWSETMRVMEVMDEARRQLGVVYPGEPT